MEVIATRSRSSGVSTYVRRYQASDIRVVEKDTSIRVILQTICWSNPVWTGKGNYSIKKL